MVKSLILLFLSDYKPGNSEAVYTLEPEGTEYRGEQTCDAPVKALMDFAKADGHPIDDILYIASNTVVNEQHGAAEENLKKTANGHADRKGYPQPYCIRMPYDYKENGRTITRNEAQTIVYEKIEAYLAENASCEEIRFYIDYTGGMRDVSFLMTSIIRYLEFTGAKCRRILYSEYDRENSLGHIRSLENIYGIYQLINGVSEFVTTGSSLQLAKYFSGSESEAAELIGSMMNFSNAISLCDIDGISKAIDELNIKTGKFETKEAKDLDTKMLVTLMPYVRKKLFLNADRKVSYSKLIDWCLENRLIQQAVTLYVEKVPYELFEEKTESTISEMEQALDIRLNAFLEYVQQGNHADAFFEVFFDSLNPVEKLQSILPVYGKNDEVTRGDVITRLKQISQQSSVDKTEKNALDRLCSMIEDLYESDGKRNHKASDAYGQTVNQKDVKGLLATVKGSGKKICRYLLSGNTEDGETDLRGKENTAAKKAESIRMVEARKEGSEFMQALFDVMCSYLALKIVRNNMNHASELESSVGEKAAKKYLAEKGYDIDPPEDSHTATARYDCIADLIRKGRNANDRFLSLS